jgi:hypothetical protein
MRPLVICALLGGCTLGDALRTSELISYDPQVEATSELIHGAPATHALALSDGSIAVASAGKITIIAPVALSFAAPPGELLALGEIDGVLLAATDQGLHLRAGQSWEVSPLAIQLQEQAVLAFVRTGAGTWLVSAQAAYFYSERSLVRVTHELAAGAPFIAAADADGSALWLARGSALMRISLLGDRAQRARYAFSSAVTALASIRAGHALVALGDRLLDLPAGTERRLPSAARSAHAVSGRLWLLTDAELVMVRQDSFTPQVLPMSVDRIIGASGFSVLAFTADGVLTISASERVSLAEWNAESELTTITSLNVIAPSPKAIMAIEARAGDVTLRVGRDPDRVVLSPYRLSPGVHTLSVEIRYSDSEEILRTQMSLNVAATAPVGFADVQDILTEHCNECHGAAQSAHPLVDDATLRADALKRLLDVIERDDMPLSRAPLSPEQKERMQAYVTSAP